MSKPAYRGRFAPSPTGPLHAGSLVAALASWLDARAHGGSWLVRIEDVDSPRCIPGCDALILQQLDAVGLRPDEAPVWQSQRDPLYAQALARLQARALVYPCACSRKTITLALASQGRASTRFGERVYPGTCRTGLSGPGPQAWRVRTDQAGAPLTWADRRLGQSSQDITCEVGDFVLRRSDGLWAYQLAVVVDDAAQHITHVVRGEDLADNTARQIHLQHLLGLSTPRYLHLPLVLGPDGHKLSKQNHAQALAVDSPEQALGALQRAAQTLGLPSLEAGTVADWLAIATQAWHAQWHDAPPEPTLNWTTP